MNKDPLTDKQLQAIVELSNPSVTVVKAAKRLGVSERTIYLWLSDSRFQSALEEKRKEVRKEAFSKLKLLLSMSVDRLEKLLNAKSAYVRLTACRMVLDFNVKIAEMQELEERLKKLEEIVENQNYRPN